MDEDRAKHFMTFDGGDGAPLLLERR